LAKFVLYLFGAPRAELDGKPIIIDTRKAIALLAYLAVTRKPHTRDGLATLLWPELDQTKARAALRRTLSALNAAANLPWLRIEREQIALVADGNFYCDVHVFEDYIAACPPGDALPCERCRPALEEAIRLHRDDFLAGFTLRDSAAFDDWQFFQAESYRAMFGRALETLVHCAINQREWQTAIEHTRRWLTLDPLHEPAQRQLMLLYAWNGQTAAALRQYQECVRILDAELGVPPLAETTALYTAILNHAAPPPPESARSATPLQTALPSPAAQTSHSRVSLLVGRDAEWASLQAAYHAAREQGRLVVIEGEAGVGKTTLAGRFAREQAHKGASVLSVVCYEGEAMLAYAPLAALLQQANAQPEQWRRLLGIDPVWLTEIGRLQPTLLRQSRPTQTEPPPDPLAAQSRFFAGLTHAVVAVISGEHPGVLLLDDVHCADSATLDWLTYFVHRLGAHRLCVILTWRSESALPGHRLRQLLAECVRRGAATVIELGRFRPAVVSRWVEQALPGNIDEVTLLAERLYRETEGLPYFVAEYLHMLASDDGARPTDASWSSPAGVRTFLHARLAPLSEIARQTLAGAAIMGRSFDLATVAEVSGRGEEETVAGLDELLTRRLVYESGPDRLDFSHAQLRQVVYEELSQVRRRLLHRRAAAALAAQARRRGDEASVAGALARHYQLGGEMEKAAHFAYLAGEQAQRVYANHEAVTYFEQALDLGTPERCAAQIYLGDLHMLLGEYGKAEQAYTAALASCSPERRGEVEHRMGRLYERLGDSPAASRRFAAAHDLLAPHAALERAQLLADWSLTTAHMADLAGALELARMSQTAAEESGEATALARAHTLLSVLLRRAGDVDGSRSAGVYAAENARRQHDPGVLTAALNSLALAYADAGNPDSAISLVEEALAQAVRMGDRHREAALRNTLADLHHASGDDEQAMIQLKQAVMIFAEIGSRIEGENAEIWMLREW
jgi:DNA-binding SARP family transcriptional activator